MNKANNWWFVLGIVALSTFAQNTWAATCTSKASGNWNSAATWNCTAGTIPAGGDTVVIASPHTVTLNNNYSAANLTINSGGVLVDGGRDLTLSGNAVINGTYNGTGNNGQLIMTGIGKTLSGNGTFIDISRIKVDNSVTIPVGASLELTLNAEIRVLGTLTINGSVTGAGQNASNRILRVDGGGALVVGATGAINAPNSVGEIRTNATATNSGSVILQSLTTQGTGTWANLPGASCAAPPVCVGGTVNSINLASASPTNAASVSWTVTFNSSVTGVTAGNFALVNSGLGGAPAITGVSGGGTTWTVSASTGTGAGTLGLNMANVSGISPAIVTPMPFAGQVYAVDRQAPAVSSIVLANPSPTSLASVSWTVTFSEAVTGVDATDFALVQAGGLSGAAITGVVAVSGTVYTVTAGTGAGNGTLGLNLADNDSIMDAASNPLGGAGGGNGNFSGDVYSVIRPLTVTASPTLCVNDTSIGTQSWTGLTNVGAQDNVYATATATNSQITNYLKCTKYNFSIPAGATITGITVGPWVNATRTFTVNAMQLVKGDVIQATNLAAGTAIPNGGGAMRPNPTQLLFGGNTNLWGNTWTVDDINSPTFGAAFAAQRGTFNTVQTVGVDAMPITIDYTLPVTPPSPIAEYRMDESSWSGTANEAINSVSGAYNGTAAGLTTKPTTSSASPAIAGSPGTCRYGVFNRSNKDYLALAGFPNLAAAAGEFAITAWINVADNTLPGQRIFIDDETNSSPGGWGFSVGETTAFGVGGLRFYYRQPSVYTLDTVAIPSNQWLFVALSVRLVAGANASSATIYAYNTAGTLVASNTGTFTWTAGSDPGPASIGGETNASGEGTNAFGFGGNLDEVRVYQTALSQSQVVAIAAETHACTVFGPDHLEIQHASGTGLTCAASTLTIKACADASCATPYTGGVSGTLSATGTPTVNWDGTTGGATGAGFVIPSGSSSVTKNVQVATAGTVSFGIASPSPAPSNVTSCNFGSPACTFSASLAGFVFSNTTTGSTYTIPDQVSGIATPTLYLRALQASTTNPAVCTPAIIGQTAGVTMGYACNNPAACQAGSLTAVNATAVASTGTSVNLTFDANGSAPITARYDDAGQITLNASKTVTPFGGATAVTLNGSSNAFVVKPDHFDLSGIQQTAAPNLVNPAAADATGNKFVMAGEQFSVTVTAKNALGATTANYGNETLAESVKLTPTLASGLGLTNNPAVGGAFGAFTGGVATGTAFTWSDVGIIKLTPSVGDGDYLGAGDVSGTQTGNIGRFYAAKFVLSGGVIANRTALSACPAPAGCGTFTYMGEEMSAAFSLMAQAVGGTRLQNYVDTFAKFDPVADPLNLDVIDNPLSPAVRTPLGARVSMAGLPAVTGQFLSTCSPAPACLGSANVTVPFMISRSASVEGPYAAFDVGIAPQDSDGALMATYDLDTVNLVAGANNHALIARTEVRYGRIKLSNAHGSELLKLPLTATVQFWNGTFWVTSVTDSVTSLTLAATYNLLNKSGAITGTTSPTPTGAAAFTNGILNISLSKPTGGAGSTTVVPTVPTYLPLTGGRATFGVYKGNNEFIYLRENY